MRPRAAGGHSSEQGNQNQATTAGLRGDVPHKCLRSRSAGRSNEARQGNRTDAVRSRTEGSTESLSRDSSWNATLATA